MTLIRAILVGWCCLLSVTLICLGVAFCSDCIGGSIVFYLSYSNLTMGFLLVCKYCRGNVLLLFYHTRSASRRYELELRRVESRFVGSQSSLTLFLCPPDLLTCSVVG